MEINEIKTVLIKNLSLEEVYVSGLGNHFQVIAVSTIFSGMERVKKQQIIYKPLMEFISHNHIHALSIKTYTPEEWKRARKLEIFKCLS
ncbi:MAG: BolA family iron metabolism protein IbaG [Sodalis sp. (in: enterobacteria)]